MAATSIVVTLIVLMVAIGVMYYRSTMSVERTQNPVENYVPVPVRKDGVVFVTDGAQGVARQASIELAKHGYHVLVGCKTDAEVRSFAFDARKGLEMIKFDIADPSTFVTLIYRLRQVRRDLDRPIVGIVLNLAGYLEDYSGEPSTNYLDVISMDRHYKALFKGPVRLLQSIFELLRHYQLEADTSDALLLPDQPRAGRTKKDVVVDTQGLRVTALYGEYVPEQRQSGGSEGEEARSQEAIRACGAKCDVQAAFLNYLEGFALATADYTNFTIANVRSPLALSDAAAGRAQYDTWSARVSAANGGADVDLISPRGEKAYDERVRAWRLKRIQKFTHSHVKWTINDGGGDGAGGAKGCGEAEGTVGEEPLLVGGNMDSQRQQVSRVTKAILHSFLSPYPEEFYI